jgi:DUF438 domain-containing protein
MEQRLIEEGMAETEVRRLCDVHVAVFKEALEKHEIPGAPAGHPVHTFMLENRASEEIMDGIDEALNNIGTPPDEETLKSKIHIHYLRKENQLFPLLEVHDISGPSQVMWAIHDDIRAQLKTAKAQLSALKSNEGIASLKDVVAAIREMIYKEEHILYPMSLETLSEAEWSKVRQGEEEIGTHLPVDLTLVDEEDRVAYYSKGKERIFPRSPGIIGRTVQRCHPPDSVHIVTKILDSFRAGTKDTAEFWIEMDGKFILIRYFAIRATDGTYKGCLEVSQDVTEIRQLEGQRRLLDWD